MASGEGCHRTWKAATGVQLAGSYLGFVLSFCPHCRYIQMKHGGGASIPGEAALEQPEVCHG